MASQGDVIRDAVLASLRNDRKIAGTGSINVNSNFEKNVERFTASYPPGGFYATGTISQNEKQGTRKRLECNNTYGDLESAKLKENETHLVQRKKKSRKRALSTDANWKALRKKLPKAKRQRRNDTWKQKAEDTSMNFKKRSKDNIETSQFTDAKLKENSKSFSAFMKRAVRNEAELTKVVAMDCEMVGVGPDGRTDALARVSVVNYAGDVLYDTFVKPGEPVKDYRTQWSGVRAEDIDDSSNAVTTYDAQRVVGELLKDRIVVGHALKNDFRVLRLAHPWHLVRDTSDFYRKLWKRRRTSRPGLKMIVAQVLGVDTFQKGEHDSCEDARAALALYKKHSKEWERNSCEGGSVKQRSQSKAFA